VKNEWQGAVFFFTGGLEAGTERLSWGPDGMLYAGGTGGFDGGWSYKLSYGLQKLKYNGKPTFEMLAVRALPKALEIEFTEPVGSGAEAASTYAVRSWYYKPTSAYGGYPQGVKTLAVKSVAVSSDRKKITLELPDMEEKRVVNIRISTALKSESGDALWTKETWYTHNFAGPGTSASAREVEARALARDFHAYVEGGSLRLSVPFQGAYELRLFDMRGAAIRALGGLSGQKAIVPLQGLPSGICLVQARSGGQVLNLRVLVP
jgi:hypothetical protein